ncbi:precorrin-3B C(17)-methyltransferase [Rubidibacter lacunae]|uniref:precorrin-3B C(17)-methyltransferase n=1 Tax=Rubidibacter lacunae TaxID=582514 RepID=UPI00040C82DB|nr:precorrin-3B C(17)-methyltransferase [Rubidibacter lacunae]
MSDPLFVPYLPLSAIALTPSAARTLQPLVAAGATLWVPPALMPLPDARPYEEPFGAWLAAQWLQQRAFVFAMATGAVVRAIAPLLSNKSSDPPVVVVDRAGQFALGLCGSHAGGGNRLTRLVANYLGAVPVLTDAAADADLPSVDVLGVPFGWHRGNGNWTAVSAAGARSEPIRVWQSAGSHLWREQLPDDHPFVFATDAATAPLAPEAAGKPIAELWIDAVEREFPPETAAVQWHPRVLWIGIGCERGTPQALLESALARVLAERGLTAEAIAGVATLDLKADEPGLRSFCRDRDLPLQVFAPEVLQAVPVPNPSEVVAEAVGTPSVAEAAALQAAGDGAELLVPKQIERGEGGAATIAIAQAVYEFTGRSGRLYLVGIGPGATAQVTPAARAALQQADVLVGYARYLDCVAPLRRPGQIVEPYPIGAELERARRAIALAEWGLTVAVVSSGDAGIYGIGGVVMEELRQLGWDGREPAVEIFPGITALQSAAARVGTPLMHDFCAISLSDLLTPWSAIAARLEAAASADFVTALYNPQSRDRKRPFAAACEIFMRYRDPETPVAIVRNALRKDERVYRTQLDRLEDAPVDMVCTVIIGNRSTQFYGDWMLTPRGYLGFGADENTPADD